MKVGVSLYRHNQAAYRSAVKLLSETGKAAVIHPTGTGKSFIAFKLCEDNPDKTVCWLSPSEYIFETQVENLKATGAAVPENIRFLTYARLMLMSEAEAAEIKADCIVLDEFHRCGAEMWGKGVARLLKACPDAPVLGLSATNIRYLDNQRDMADELFDGNIASGMTLGEAIVSGILNPPKYVLSVFSYRKDLERYEERVRKAKSKAVRDAAREYLDALRRALEKADGLDVIFDKHMTDRTGKYIVFCSNVEHLCEMSEYAPQWFAKVDPDAHIYRAYSDNPETSKAFAAFKADDSEHLKLLFCIDMLNEGVHVEDISGVILLRPTVSPIIYKQQIGRALSASKRKDAVIFDVVLNIESLYSIGAIEEEMKVAMTYYLEHGMGEGIVNERFKVIDEVRDCVELFDKLNDTLTASWELMYSHAEKYFRENGNLEVPGKYKTEDGCSLGHWLQTQRKVRAGEQYGTLTAERIAKLDAIGMVWEGLYDLAWNKYYAAAKEYREQCGNLDVGVKYVHPNGVCLGRWICNLRTWRKSGNNSRYMTEERIKALDELGMIWDQPDFLWERNFAAAMEYYHRNGDLDVPAKCVVNGVKLGNWIRNMRGVYSGKSKAYAELTESQIARLNEIGMLWTDKPTRQWEKGFSEAREFYDNNGNLNVPVNFKSALGYRLGAWLDDQREYFGKGKLSSERRERLEQIGMVWQKPYNWDVRYAVARAYYEKHGDLNVPSGCVIDGVWLNKWLNEQRQKMLGKRSGALTGEQIEKLKAIGFELRTRFEILWDERYEEAKAAYDEIGSLDIPGKYGNGRGKSILIWLAAQRKRRKAGKLSPDRIEKLSALGMAWERADARKNQVPQEPPDTIVNMAI